MDDIKLFAKVKKNCSENIQSGNGNGIQRRKI